MNKKIIFIIIAIIMFFISIINCEAFQKEVENSLDHISNVADDLSEDIQVLLRKDFTEEERYYIGRSTSAYILSKYELFKDEILLEYINQIGNTISFASNKSVTFKGYRFLLFKSEYPNAYATPGGFIFLSTGMLKLCDNEDELAAVIAHEVEHIVKDHPMKAVNNATKEAALINIATYYSSNKHDDKKVLSNIVDNFGETLKDIFKAFNGYEKQTEYQADKGAVTTLYNAGYSVTALKSIIAKLPYSKGAFDYGSHHPEPGERITAINKEINNLEIVSVKVSKKRTSRFIKMSERLYDE